MMTTIAKKFFLYFSICFCINIFALGNMPLGQDKRVVTYVYSPDEIYTVKTEFNFQTSIEFSPQEEVKTIAVGDSYSWSITPVGRTIFINPQMENSRTNMTVVTNLKTYYFDLVVSSEDNIKNYCPTYVIKFYYPK